MKSINDQPLRDTLFHHPCLFKQQLTYDSSRSVDYNKPHEGWTLCSLLYSQS